MDAMTTGWRRIGVVALGTFWVAVATAETLLMDNLDALDDVAAIAANSERIAMAGLFHVLGGVLLVFALAAIAPLAWRSAPGRIGWVLTAVLPACLGAVGMVHLLAAEMGAPGLDAAAMQEFLIERLSEAPGLWTVPVLYGAFVGGFAPVVLVAGLARVRMASWWSVGVIGVGALVHFFFSSENELVEAASHWVIAAGLAWVAASLWRAWISPGGRGSSPSAAFGPATDAVRNAEASVPGE